MKLFVTVILVASLLAGCTNPDDSMEQAVAFRKQLLASEGCTFQTVITADYGDVLHTFRLDCVSDRNGELRFTVTEPETITGITGTITDEMSALTFDDKVLAFPLLANGEMTPISAPWVLIHTLQSGYLTACGKQEDGYCLYIDDSFEEDTLRLQITTDTDLHPEFVEIIWKGCRILTLEVLDFTLL